MKWVKENENIASERQVLNKRIMWLLLYCKAMLAGTLSLFRARNFNEVGIYLTKYPGSFLFTDQPQRLCRCFIVSADLGDAASLINDFAVSFLDVIT